MENVKIYKRLPYIFALALIVAEIYKLKKCDLQRVGKIYGVLFSQLRPSMTDVKIYKTLPPIFALLLTTFQIYKNFIIFIYNFRKDTIFIANVKNLHTSFLHV